MNLDETSPKTEVDVYDIDAFNKDDRDCEQFVPDHVKEIYVYLRHKERTKYPIDPPDYIKCQPNLTWTMRTILIDWLIDVGLKFRLLNDTIHLTMALIDRFLAHSCVVVNCDKLQLVGITIMWIACKVEEVYEPEAADFLYICDRAYMRGQLLTMERTVLNALWDDIYTPTTLHLLNWRGCTVDFLYFYHQKLRQPPFGLRDTYKHI